MEIILTMALWLLMGSATSYFASQRGRDPFVWFIIGMLLGVIGLLLLFLLPPVVAQENEDQPVMEELLPPEKNTFEEQSIRFKDWFYLDASRQQQGPVSFQVLRKQWDQGNVKGDTLVWSDGMDQWQKIDDLTELKESL